ncbi:PIN domain-containing protein [bacterium]|nr:PIN domain-containing protein [bacterium]
MTDKVFLDTNVLIYAYSVDEKEKQEKATQLLNFYSEQLIISNQVLNEISNTLFKKFRKTSLEVRNVILEISSALTVVNFHLKTQLVAITIKERYGLQFYDSLIIATALEYGCTKLISEDMQHGLVIDNCLTIENPFIGIA